MNDKRLNPCPFCGGPCKTIQGEASEQIWKHRKFWRVYCTRCQSRQLFHRSEAKAIRAWNHRVTVTIEGLADRCPSHESGQPAPDSEGEAL